MKTNVRLTHIRILTAILLFYLGIVLITYEVDILIFFAYAVTCIFLLLLIAAYQLQKDKKKETVVIDKAHSDNVMYPKIYFSADKSNYRGTTMNIKTNDLFTYRGITYKRAYRLELGYEIVLHELEDKISNFRLEIIANRTQTVPTEQDTLISVDPMYTEKPCKPNYHTPQHE